MRLKRGPVLSVPGRVKSEIYDHDLAVFTYSSSSLFNGIKLIALRLLALVSEAEKPDFLDFSCQSTADISSSPAAEK